MFWRTLTIKKILSSQVEQCKITKSIIIYFTYPRRSHTFCARQYCRYNNTLRLLFNYTVFCAADRTTLFVPLYRSRDRMRTIRVFGSIRDCEPSTFFSALIRSPPTTVNHPWKNDTCTATTIRHTEFENANDDVAAVGRQHFPVAYAAAAAAASSTRRWTTHV